MSQMTASQLQTGIIFGDTVNAEYIYMPAGEVGADEPLCVFEKGEARSDLSLPAAAALVQRLSLKPARHPRLGRRSF
ncbi:MAG: hypothetical protein E6X17_05585 [Sporomusaceae bacterium]|nr:hypothetical protein [Sporomusaceae bacterium]